MHTARATLPIMSKPATYQDVIDAPENKVAELLNGELWLQSRPALRHSVAEPCAARWLR